MAATMKRALKLLCSGAADTLCGGIVYSMNYSNGTHRRMRARLEEILAWLPRCSDEALGDDPRHEVCKHDGVVLAEFRYMQVTWWRAACV